MSTTPERTRVAPRSEGRRTTGDTILNVGPEVVVGAALRMGRNANADLAVLRRVLARLQAQAASGDAATPAVLAWLERHIQRRESAR